MKTDNKLLKVLFGDYTKWEVLEVYKYDAVDFCVQVRMNKRTGFRKFKVTRITPKFSSNHSVLSVAKINELTTLKN
jgi:hypothetical protein